MALMQGRVQRVEIPHEPGEWMEFRRLSVVETRDRKLLSVAALTEPIDKTATPDAQEARESARVWSALEWARACVVGWSYAEPFTTAGIDLLDVPTLVWASVTSFQLTHGLETATEKKVDSPSSTATSTESPAPSAPTTGG